MIMRMYAGDMAVQLLIVTAQVQQEEVALNRRRNKVDMEKVFATVISLAIMVALVVGVVSILRSNNSKGDNKQNYIDLNEINEALGESGQNTPESGESMEEQTNVARNDEKDIKDDKSNDEKNTTKGNDNSVNPSEESVESGENDVAKNTDNKGQKDAENTVGEESTAAQQENTSDNAEVGATVADGGTQDEAQTVVDGTDVAQAGESLPADNGENVSEGVQTAEGETVENPENIGDTTPVNASTATILGYNFNEESTMMWPATGDVILNYNMTNTIYFPTLDVYRCNPAIVISAPEDSVVCAAADGIVIAVYETNETGLTMEIALGNDYVMTYGQLKNLAVGVGSQVKRGDVLAAVAAPSQYYTVEGSNLYFKLDKAGTSVNPMDFIDAE